MNSNKSNISLSLVAAPLIIAAILATGMIFEVQSLRASQQRIEHDTEVIAAARTLLKLTLDMETGLRGYQYTGRVEILQPYTEATQIIDSRFATLDQLVWDDSAQQTQLAKIHHSFEQWRRLAASAIERRSDHSIQDSDEVRYNQTLEGKASMDIIRQQYDVFISGEIFRRGECAHTARLQSLSLIVTCVLIALGGVIGVGLFLWRRMRNASAQEKEEMIRLSEEKLRLMILGVKEHAIMMLDTAGRTVTWNEGAERIKGYRDEEMGGNFSMQYPAESEAQDKLATELKIAAENGRFEEERWRVGQDGSRYWASVLITALHDESGRLSGFAKVIRDIGAPEQALLTAETLRTAIFNSAKFSIIATDARGVIQIFNVGAERMLGYKAIEVVNKITPVDISDPQELVTRAEMLSRELNTSITAGFEALVFKASHGIEDIYEPTYIRKDGSRLPAVVSVTALRGAEGEIVGYLLIGTDNTVRWQAEEKRKAAESALQEANARINLATENGGIGIWVWDIPANSLTCDPVMYQLYGLPPGETGVEPFKFWTDRVHPDDLGMVEQALGNLAAGTGSYDPIFRVVWDDGSMHYIRAAAQVEEDPSGRVTRIVGTNMDITDLVLTGETARQAMKIAETSNRIKADFLANMSHEIRTPMNAILGMTHLALRANPTEQQRGYLTKIGNAGQSLLSIMNDILDFSKIEAGKLELEHIGFSLDDVWNNVIDIVGHKAEQKKIAIAFSLAPEIPPFLKGDPLRLGQILINLVNNAIKFTEEGEIGIAVTAEISSPHERRLKFSVSDTGIGMSKEQVANLFQSFNQADTSITRKYGGTGLGLAISKQLCELMGGSIWVDSEPSKGSTFSFTVSFGIVDGTLSASLAAPMGELRGKRVLIVDDSELTRNELLTILLAKGFKARAVSSGEEGFSALTGASQSGEPFDLVLMDWRLPGIDGIEASRRIKGCVTLSNVPAILMISAFDREHVMEANRNLSLDGFLHKPVTEAALMTNIARIFAANGDANLPASQQKVVLAPTNLSGRRVLVVEDNDINCDLATELLSDLGIVVAIAMNGRQGVDRIFAEQFDLVLMDIQMPIMDGLTATRLIRDDERFRQLPIIAMTAHAMSGDRERSLHAGMNDHLTKPINPRTLTEALLRWMPVVAPPKPVIEPEKLAAAQDGVPDLLPPFDIRAALGRTNGKPKLLRKMLLRFRDQFANAGDDLRQSIAEGRVEDAERLAHSLKGIAATLEADELSKAALAIELAFRTKNTKDVGQLIEVLEIALAPAIAAASSLDEGTPFPIASPPDLTPVFEAST